MHKDSTKIISNMHINDKNIIIDLKNFFIKSPHYLILYLILYSKNNIVIRNLTAI